VESALSGATGGGNRNAMDLGRSGCLDDEAASGSRQDAGACEKGRAGVHRQSLAACALARGHFAGRARHLQCRDCGLRGQSLVRPPLAGPGPAGKCRSGRHRSDARDPQHRAAGDREPAESVAVFAEARRRQEARLQVRRGLPQMERQRAGSLADQADESPESDARFPNAARPLQTKVRPTKDWRHVWSSARPTICSIPAI
jgi:hypothetical protein